MYVVISYCMIPIFAVFSITTLVVGGHASMRDPKHIESGFNKSKSRRIKSDRDDDSDDDDDEQLCEQP